jgi:DNA repair protein RadC
METLVPNNLAEIRLTYKSNVRAADRPKIKGSKDAYDLLIKNWNPEKIELLEEFKVFIT